MYSFSRRHTGELWLWPNYISASAVFKDIICAEYTEANRRELGKWLSNDDDKFDWSVYVFFKYVAVLEGKR